jgi:hypothetical protein
LELTISLKAALTPRVGERFLQVVLGAEHEVDREHPGLRLQGRRVGGRGDRKIDIARAQLLQDLRLLAELRARELVDRHRAVAHFGQFVGEGVGGDAIGRRVRLVVGEAEAASLRRLGPDARQCGHQERQNAGDSPSSAHRFPPPI